MSMPNAPKIVVADDNPATLYATGRILESAGYAIERCSRGLAALAAIGPDTDVAVVDINMPDIDGIEVCRQLRSRSDTSQIAIIHLTATALQDSDRAEGLEAGADAYLTHPVHPQVLLATIRTLLRARRAEAERRASEIKFRGIFEQASCGIAVLDRDLVFADANPEVQRMLDRGVEELRGRSVFDFVAGTNPGERDAALAALQRTGSWSGILRVPSSPGQALSMQWDVSPRLGDDHVLAIVTDVTERARLEAERGRLFAIERRARAEAEANARAKDEFLATLSHELRNPLAPLRNALYVLNAAGADGAQATKAREVMGRQVDQMTRLVDDLMDVSRITRGLVELAMQRTPLRGIVEHAIEASQPQFDAGGHAFTAQLPEAGVEVLGDALRLTQVFTNILNNAAKYTQRQGRIALTTSVDADRIEVAIEDNGVGIAPEMQHRIFDIFTQVNPTGPVSAGGLGIGLTLVRRLVEMHDGRVSVTSGGVGHGSRFVVTLPVYAADASTRGA